MTTHKRYPYFGVPPPKTPRPAADEPALRGKRVILSQPYGFVYDQRATREPYTNPDNGKRVVDICTEAHWYRWMYAGEKPERQTYPLHLVWIELWLPSVEAKKHNIHTPEYRGKAKECSWYRDRDNDGVVCE